MIIQRATAADAVQIQGFYIKVQGFYKAFTMKIQCDYNGFYLRTVPVQRPAQVML